MAFLEVNGLEKHYSGFALQNVSFSLERGTIMGLIGRNGAGKTTLMKAMLNFISHDGGTVTLNGLSFYENELALKPSIGFVSGGFSAYRTKRLSTITDVTRRFYPNWDETCYRTLLNRFELDERKKVSELSQGMAVKYSLALALSHRATLLVLDEPTSGLDPVSREDLLCLLGTLAVEQDVAILYSTHILSDLEKHADYITYLKDGQVLLSDDCDRFKARFLLVSGERKRLPEHLPYLIGHRENAFGFTGLIHASDADAVKGLRTAPADMETIMIYWEQEKNA